jgi:myo-inositol-1(or 4)-monophosphatase
VPDASEDLALLVRAAEDGGRIAMRHFGRAVRHREKPGGAGPVSDADLEIDAALAATLRGARPDYGWLSEETPDTADRLARARVFVLDPLDGTRAFLNGDKGFALALAVVEEGRPLAGVVHAPALGETYAAARGAGATRNGRAIRVSGRQTLADARVLASRGQLEPAHWPGGVPPVRREVRPALARRLCLVAAGRFEAVVTFRPAWEWDIAAGGLIAAEAGATVTDGEGHALAFNAEEPRASGLIAAPPAIHAALLARRRPD